MLLAGLHGLRGGRRSFVSIAGRESQVVRKRVQMSKRLLLQLPALLLAIGIPCFAGKALAVTDSEPGSAQAAAATGEAETPAAAAETGTEARIEAQAVVASEIAAPEPQLENLKDVVTRVWRDNPQVRQAEQALKATGFDITAARAGYLPYLQVQSAVAEKSEESVSTLYVVLPLWQGGLTGAQVDTAKANERAALAEVARTRLELGQRTLDAYFNVAAAQDQQIQWANYVGALKRLHATIKRRADTGLAPQADVDTATSRLKQALAGAEANRALLLTNRSQLASLLGASPASLAWPDESSMLPESDIASYRSRITQHPQYLAARAEIEAQKGAARTARASLWPELSLQHRRQLEGAEFDPSNDATLLVVQFQSNNGLSGLYSYRAEQQRIEAFKARLAAVERDIQATLESDKTQLEATASQLEVQYEAAEAASALVESFIRQFEAGRKSWLEVLNAQREANDIRLQSITLRRNYWFANAKLALDSMNWGWFGAEVVNDTSPASEEQ